MKPRRKHNLPDIFKLSWKVDLKQMQQELNDRFLDKFIDVYKADPRLFTNTTEMAKSLGDSFNYVNLTVFNENEAGDWTDEQVAEEESLRKTLSTAQKYKRRLKPADPRMYEFNYNKHTEDYKGTYFEEISDMFKSRVIRSRLTRLSPMTVLDPHIDYDPTYAVRIIIPIISNPDTLTILWRKGDRRVYNFHADGSVYFINTGFRHAVVNFGKEDRINLMISLADQQDLEEIPENWREIEEYNNLG